MMWWGFLLIITSLVCSVSCMILLFGCWVNDVGDYTLHSVLRWHFAQFMPEPLRKKWTSSSWLDWEQTIIDEQGFLLDIPTVDIQQYDRIVDIEEELKFKYGDHWRRRPLLLKNIWTSTELARTNRTLSLQGLLKENMTIPYFTNAAIPYTLSPDATGSIPNIVANITKGAPHKIATQLLVQKNPHLIQEVAPHRLVTALFGNYFNPHNVNGRLGGLLPGLSVVPLFVAKSQNTNTNIDTQTEEPRKGSDATACRDAPRTDLHCEPISNVAVQLEGKRDWTLISPEFSLRLKPSISPDGRAFFYSSTSSTNLSHVPHYKVTTKAGEALWVPTWTWHRIDYANSDHISIGASLFHFRPLEFLRNNPLFGISIIPSLIMEVAGLQAQ